MAKSDGADRKRDNRRVARFEVCASVEVCVLERATRDAVSPWLHAVIRDVSRGGFRLHVLGELQRILSATGVDQTIQIRFLPPPMDNDTVIEAEVRWSRACQLGPGWEVGVLAHFVSATEAKQILAQLRRYGRPRRPLLRWFAIAVVLVALGAAWWRSSALSERLRLRLQLAMGAIEALEQVIEEQEQDLENNRALVDALNRAFQRGIVERRAGKDGPVVDIQAPASAVTHEEEAAREQSLAAKGATDGFLAESPSPDSSPAEPGPDPLAESPSPDSSPAEPGPDPLAESPSPDSSPAEPGPDPLAESPSPDSSANDSNPDSIPSDLASDP